MSQPLTIGQVAKQTGLSIDTIRFYEKERLLKHPVRSEGGFRLFSPDHVQTLRFIRTIQELGFSLGEIRELLILRGKGLHACQHVGDLLAQKLATVREKIEELQTLEESLKSALRKCNRQIKSDGGGHEDRCPVLEEIGRSARTRDET